MHDHHHHCSHEHHHHDEAHSHGHEPEEFESEKAEQDHHHHGHHHHHHPGDASQKLFWVFALTAGYTVTQFIGSYLSGSLALMADSGHMLSDCISLGVALTATKIAKFKGSSHHTFGYARFEILAALFNGLLLMAVAIGIFYEALGRIVEPHAVKGQLMLGFAIGGLIVNIIAAKLLHADHHHNLNVRGAYLHVISDLMGSIGAIIAGILLLTLNWGLADTVISLLIAVLVLASALRLVRDAIRILMEGVPRHLSVPQIQEALLKIDGVQALHNVHVWQLNSDKIALTAHLVVRENAYTEETLRAAQTLLTAKFHFNHTTLQLELDD